MRHSGFTLVELLIVMALMGLAMSLIGPATVGQVEKMQAQAELRELRGQIRKASYLAYTGAQPMKLLFQDAMLVSMADVSEAESVEGEILGRFRFLHFPSEQVIRLNHNGYPDPESLELVYRGERREINLFRLVEATE